MAYNSETQNKGANGASLYSFMRGILNIFQKKVTGGATTITDDNLTASRALVSNGSGKVAVSSVTSTELGHLSGVSSNVQTQLDGKASTSTVDGKMNKTINVDGTPVTTGGTVYYEGGDGIAVTWTEEDKLNFANTMMTSATIGGAKLFSDTTQSVAANSVTTQANRTYGIQKNGSNQLVVNVPWTDTSTDISGKQDKIKVGTATSGAITTISAGSNISITISGSTATLANTYAYTLPVATTSAIGGVKIAATKRSGAITTTSAGTTGSYLGLEIDTNNKGFVNLPQATTSAIGGVKLHNAIDGTSVTDTSGSVTANAVTSYAAPKESPALTGTPTAPTATTGTNTTQIATTAFVQSQISASQAGFSSFKGTIDGSTTTEATIKAMSYKVGWYWVVGTAGTYFGEYCEAGDHVYCIKDKGSSASNSDFSVVQTNVEWLTDADVADIINEAISA